VRRHVRRRSTIVGDGSRPRAPTLLVITPLLGRHPFAKSLLTKTKGASTRTDSAISGLPCRHMMSRYDAGDDERGTAQSTALLSLRARQHPRQERLNPVAARTATRETPISGPQSSTEATCTVVRPGRDTVVSSSRRGLSAALGGVDSGYCLSHASRKSVHVPAGIHRRHLLIRA
jgi:hypothetical protein